MNGITELAKGMAEIAINKGSEIAFNTSIIMCEKLSQAYALHGNQAACAAAQECANGIKGLRDKIISASPATGER